MIAVDGFATARLRAEPIGAQHRGGPQRCHVGANDEVEKLGFRFERDTVHPGLPHVLYRLRVSSV